MAVTVYCVNCGRGEVITVIGELPDCRVCGPTKWKTATDPRVDYEVNHNDKRFLKSIRIDPEV